MEIRVSEIFYSINGEGSFCGTATVFVRLYACNLSCDFCDEPLHKSVFETYTLEDFLEKVNSFGCETVTLTGGEPSLNDINPLIVALKEWGFFVCVETNGYNLANIKEANWITYSPKDWQNIHEGGVSEYKFIVDKESDMAPILALKTDKQIYIQPKADGDTPNMENVKFCVEFVKTHPHLKLSLQLHKFIDEK